MYYKTIEDGYITSISTGTGQEEITLEEYDRIISAIHSSPTAEAGYKYRLKKDLTWDRVELPLEIIDPDLSDTEAMGIILGVVSE